MHIVQPLKCGHSDLWTVDGYLNVPHLMQVPRLLDTLQQKCLKVSANNEDNDEIREFFAELGCSEIIFCCDDNFITHLFLVVASKPKKESADLTLEMKIALITAYDKTQPS